MNRHRFEPARLVLGVLLLGAAVAYAMDALGEWDVPYWLLLAAAPVALVAAACTALTTHAVRRHLRGRRAGAGVSAEAGAGAGSAVGPGES